MPGILRFFLSILVIFSHLSGAHSASHFGYYAVRAFFVLSGIVLTKSLNETYSFDFYRFYINRLLRIVPLYALVCGITIVVIHCASGADRRLHAALGVSRRSRFDPA